MKFRKTLKKIKIFNVDDYEWWAGESLGAVRKSVRGQYGYGEDYLDDVYEISKQDMKRFKFYDEDGSVRTFKAVLKRLIKSGCQFPCVFAVSDISMS